MKWVGRISKDFDVAESSTANMVYQEALDCFCACLAKPDKRLPLAEAIAAKLNITKVKVSYCEFAYLGLYICYFERDSFLKSYSCWWESIGLLEIFWSHIQLDGQMKSDR